ncbi:MBL fold metallo-hydrolase [Methanomicrobiaceae archaeon CYW5]|uniref:MBL fold metallo-hydrolase n=1 Tax=Methanovulcanius yangii TaxID=1789227 RepID=UPI0029CA49B1|nr:MBL fold metallo-hydrolase [Methanovulcanius yangii]MBT8507544.1 MBL fold metallo-hydrolase [Methanovulcanius yangii]
MQIVPFIHALRHPFTIPVAPGVALERFVYSFLVYGETITLIDTGVAGCERRIFDYIRSTDREASDITEIVLTHSHPDHIGAARAIQEVTGCSIAAHAAEKAWIEDVALQYSERPVPGFAMLVGGSVEVDHPLRDGDTTEPDPLHEWELEVIHTPGHSPGSISIFMHGNGALFSGDAIPVEGDIPVYDDALATVASLQRLRDHPGIRVLLSAWDEPTTGDEMYRRMDRGAAYLQAIHDAVRASAGTGTTDPMEVTRRTADALGLPSAAVTPLLARTIAANLRLREMPNLLLAPAGK